MGLTSKTIKLTNFTYNALEINVPDSTLEFGYDYTNMLLKMPNTTVSIDVTYSTWWFGEATGQVTVDIDKANIQLPILLNLVDGRMSVQIDTNAIAD